MLNTGIPPFDSLWIYLNPFAIFSIGIWEERFGFRRWIEKNYFWIILRLFFFTHGKATDKPRCLFVPVAISEVREFFGRSGRFVHCLILSRLLTLKSSRLILSWSFLISSSTFPKCVMFGKKVLSLSLIRHLSYSSGSHFSRRQRQPHETFPLSFLFRLIPISNNRPRLYEFGA